VSPCLLAELGEAGFLDLGGAFRSSWKVGGRRGGSAGRLEGARVRARGTITIISGEAINSAGGEIFLNYPASYGSRSSPLPLPKGPESS